MRLNVMRAYWRWRGVFGVFCWCCYLCRAYPVAG